MEIEEQLKNSKRGNGESHEIIVKPIKLERLLSHERAEKQKKNKILQDTRYKWLTFRDLETRKQVCVRRASCCYSIIESTIRMFTFIMSSLLVS